MKTKSTKKTKTKIPQFLIYEMKNGKPIYYKNYQLVLQKKLSPEAIMGSSALQSNIIRIILKFLFINLNPEKYIVLPNEVGFQWEKSSWRNLDIAIFNKNELLKDGIDNSYAKIPPIIVFEIDTKADTSNYPDIEFYIREKIQDLLDNGVLKIFWFTTHDKKILIAEKNQNWIITNWNYDLPIIDDLYFNLHNALINENIIID
jgi:Uma2 family endonuclease